MIVDEDDKDPAIPPAIVPPIVQSEMVITPAWIEVSKEGDNDAVDGTILLVLSCSASGVGVAVVNILVRAAEAECSSISR